MNKRLFTSYILTSFLIFFTTNAIAEDKKDPENIFLCEGVWSTNPCDSPESVLPYTSANDSEISQEERERKNKIQVILHPVRMKASEIRNEFNGNYDISYIELLCKDKSTSIKECRERASLELDKLISYELGLREQEKKEQEKPTPTVTEKTEILVPQPVYRNHIHPRLGPRRRPYRRPQRQPESTRPRSPTLSIPDIRRTK